MSFLVSVHLPGVAASTHKLTVGVACYGQQSHLVTFATPILLYISVISFYHGQRRATTVSTNQP